MSQQHHDTALRIVSKSGRAARKDVRGVDSVGVLEEIIRQEERAGQRSLVLDAARARIRSLNKKSPPPTKQLSLDEAPKNAAKKKRVWPKCSVEECDKNVYMPSGSKKLCYQHFLESGGKQSPLIRLREGTAKKKATPAAKRRDRTGEKSKTGRPKATPAAARKKRVARPANAEVVPSTVKEKTCPSCGKAAKGRQKIEKDFGYRVVKSESKAKGVVYRETPQSHCRACRSAKGKKKK